MLILGGTGMLGHKLFQVAEDRLDGTWATIRAGSLDDRAARVLNADRVIADVRAEDPDSIAAAIEASDADVVVNCIGVIKQSDAAKDPIPSISVNSLFPHQVAALCGERNIRFVHVSTDCVFSGSKGGYTEEDVPDPGDLYGRSKLLGEVTAPGSITVRTSIIGRELASSYGLVEWFLGESGGTVRGFSEALFSGFTTDALARVLIDVVFEHADLEGLWHVSADPVDKNSLLEMLRDAYEVPITIEADNSVVIDRSLDSSRFRDATGWSPPSWLEMVDGLRADQTPYEEIRRASLAHG
jgi:dTDP-4-dehydrorhamnose reductase